MTGGPEQGARAVVGSALCVLATWASMLALTGLVDGRRWFAVAGGAVLLVALSTTLARAAARRWWLPSAVGALVALVGVVLRYGAPPGRPQFLPDLDAVGRAWATARQGVMVVDESFVPMPDVRPGEMLLVVGALSVYLLLDAAVLALRVPAVGALPLVALWVPAIVLGFPAGAAPMFWTAVAYLALLAYGAAPLAARSGRLRRAATATVAGAALAATGAVIGGSLMDLPGWASVALPTFGDGPVGPLELSEDLDMRESLGTRSAQVVMTYRVTDAFPPEEAPATLADLTEAAAGPQDGATPTPSAPARPAVDARLVGPLRAFTMATFDGREWERTPGDGAEPWDPAGLLTSDPQLRSTPPDPQAGTLALVELEVAAMRSRQLPVPTFPRTVDVEGDWAYDEDRDEVVGQRYARDGLTYAMMVQVPGLTPDDLEGAEAGTPPDAALYTAVPDTAHREDIAALAAELTADADSAYDRAVALQSWLRSAANFTYDTRVPPARSADAVWDFLEDRRGYCVQFATAMAMMARTLDIPSRVGVGFLPGERNRDGVYVVTGRLAHAWPELYLDGLGWVRFEPTPATQSGPPPVWADPFVGISAPGSIPDEARTGQPQSDPGAVAPAPTAAPGAVETPESSWAPLAIGAGVVALLAALALTAVLVARRRRRPTTPEDAWATVRRDLARVDVRWSDATSPRGVVRQVGEVVAARTGGSGLDDASRAALQRLALAVERTRYAPVAPAHTAAELDAWVEQVRQGVRTTLAQDHARTPAPVA